MKCYCSVAQLCPTLRDPVDCSMKGFRSLFRLMSIESMLPFNHLILCHPSSPALNLSQHQCFSNESVLCIRWPKYWSFSFSISPSSEHSGLISFRIDWFYLLAVQGMLRSLLQNHSSKASILQHLLPRVVWSLVLSEHCSLLCLTELLGGLPFSGGRPRPGEAVMPQPYFPPGASLAGWALPFAFQGPSSQLG